jgi:hypothetical protein
MRSVSVALAAVLVVVAYLPLGLTFPSTAPALLWSPYQDGIKEAVSYETFSAKDLAVSVMSKGGWSNYLCSAKEAQQQSLDLVLIFVGGELQSLDASGNTHADPSMVDLLRGSYSNSNFSLAFPYVAAASEAMESSLVSAMSESCDSDFSDVAFMNSCNLDAENSFKKLSDSDSLYDYLASSLENGPKGKANLIVGCHKGLRTLNDVDQPHSESVVFSEIMESVEKSGAKYGVLYVSDPASRSIHYPSSREIERFLAESGNNSTSSSVNSTRGCDEVCQLKSSLLEGLLVAIVFLMILISGLCCMMGIDTPTRFETPQDS